MYYAELYVWLLNSGRNVAYKSIVRPSMEYACVVWNPHTEKDGALLDAIQNRAARWVLKSRWDPELSVD